MENEQIRKALQLAILKGMKESSQPNHQMTPDAIGMFISYLVGKFTKGRRSCFFWIRRLGQEIF